MQVLRVTKNYIAKIEIIIKKIIINYIIHTKKDKTQNKKHQKHQNNNIF